MTAAARQFEDPEVARAHESLRAASRVVEMVFDLAPETVFRETRGGHIEAFARQVAYYVVRRLEDEDAGRAFTPNADDIALERAMQTRIADALGRHHSSVWHGILVVEEIAEDLPARRGLDWMVKTTREALKFGRAFRAALLASWEEAKAEGRLKKSRATEDDAD